MPKMNEYLKHYYATAQDVLEDMCDTLITEQPYADLFAEEQEAFHEWAFQNAEHYQDQHGTDWVGLFYDWKES